MRIKINFPKNITAKSLYKDATRYTNIEEINTLTHGRLVVAWDTPTNDDTPIRFYGFLEEILFSSDCSVKYSVFCPDCGSTLHFDNVKFVKEVACPKVYYNDGELQGVGTLVGIKESVGNLIGVKESFLGENSDQHIECRVRLAPWSENCYRTVGLDQLTFVENIPLGLIKKDEKEADNVH